MTIRILVVVALAFALACVHAADLNKLPSMHYKMRADVAVTAAAGQQREPRISWVCDVKMDRERGVAKGMISLRVGSQLAVITDRPLNECYVIPQSKYQLFGIPSDAVTACHHGFGPNSEELYVLRRSAQLLVYRKRETDERRPEKPRLIKRIPYAERTHLTPMKGVKE